MDIVGGLDVHRKQITFDYVQMDTGESHRGEIRPADRENLIEWLDEFTERFGEREAAFAVEATTGWRYVVEELERAGIEAHLAEPADTKALQGRKKRAKTDRIDAKHLRDLLVIERLPESWVPPEHVQEIRTLMRMRHSMVEERSAYLQRIHAQLFHNGCPRQDKELLSAEGRERLRKLDLPGAARKVVGVCLKMVEHINEELSPIEAELRAYARAQSGCRALMNHYGVVELTSVALLSELGDTRRFSSSRKAVRFAGLDVTVHSSDEKRAAGKLSRQGSPTLRWAAYEAAKGAYRKGSPDHEYYLHTSRERTGTNRAALSIARKLLRRAHHTLRELGEEAMSEPVVGSGAL